MKRPSIAPAAALLLVACSGGAPEPGVAEPAAPPPAAEPPPAPEPQPPEVVEPATAEPDPPTEPPPVAQPTPPVWSPGQTHDQRFELFVDWTAPALLDAMAGRGVGILVAERGESDIVWTCTPGQVGERGADVRGLGSGRPRMKVALTPEQAAPKHMATCVVLIPSCDNEIGFPTTWAWDHQTRTFSDLPDANGDGEPEWASFRYVYPEVEVLFGFGGQDGGSADCSVLVGS